MTVLLTVLSLVILIIKPVRAEPDIVKIGSEFVITISKKDIKQARSYLVPNVEIPEIREETAIGRITGLPSPQKNKSVSIAYFDSGDNLNDRIAFIWELSYVKDKITDIKVVYDGANPFLNEISTIKEYETKNKVKVLTEYELPFEVTHINGTVDHKVLMLKYRNVELNSLLQIKVESSSIDLESLKNKNDEFYTLENGIEALYQQNKKQLIFQHKNLIYTINIKTSSNQKYTVDDLLRVANSMKER